MKSWSTRAFFTIAVGLTLVSCKTAAPPASAQHVERFSTEQEAEAGGLSAGDLAVVHEFLRRVSTPSSQGSEDVRECMKYFSGKAERRSYVLTNDQGLRLGVLYFPKKNRLWMIEPGAVPHDPLEMRRTKDGYLFILIQGCVHVALELVTVKGKPYALRYPANELLH